MVGRLGDSCSLVSFSIFSAHDTSTSPGPPGGPRCTCAMTPRPGFSGVFVLSGGKRKIHTSSASGTKFESEGEPGVTCSAAQTRLIAGEGSLYPPHNRLVAPVAAAPTTVCRAAPLITATHPPPHGTGSGYGSRSAGQDGEGGSENMAEEEEVQSLALTPTWVVASVCLVIVAISLAAERLLHRLGKVLKFNGQEALFSALQRVKEELMILGFISFLLSVCQNLINHICIPEKAARIMLPCIADSSKATEDAAKLCRRKGEVPMLSEEALHQLHIFIFVLGVVHVLFCVTTLVLGGAKMRKWNKWEKDIHQGRLKERENRPGWMKPSSIRWIIAFFKQFYNSVGKADYQVLRAAFVQRHYPNRPDFDFHKYMVRALEHDFKEVVGISWYLWLFVILFLLLNINGWHTYFWLSFLPLILLLIVGTKLEYISTHLAQEAAECSDEAAGNPWNKPCKEHFWFSNPRAVLHLIHFILFQNSFEMAFFFWVLATYGFDSCIMENKSYALPRLVIGIIVQVLCSYITLPLYAIVTHMGGDIKLQAFGEHVHVSVHSWATDVKKKSTSMPAHSHAHAHQHQHQHQHPHQHLRIPFLSKKRHSSRGADAEEAAAEARAAAEHHAETSGMPTAPPQRNDDLEEIVTTTEEDHRGRDGSFS